MSVYIRGMEMPKNCAYCYFKYVAFEGLVKCDLAGHDFKDYRETGYRDDCPLIPVPNHGDLIERDALKNECKENAKRGIGLWVDYMDISLVPTIIPSDHADTMYYPQVEGITPTIIHADKERDYAQR